MERVFNYYETLSMDFLGYEPKQILLLHANVLNADALSELTDMILFRGYSFISLTEALTDEAYQLPEVQADRGLSWLHRWMLSNGVQPDEQPGASDRIQALFNNYQHSE